jgi:hypothetical protein
MRNRLKIIAAVRKLHLFSSIILVVFCLTYVISGYVLFNSEWFGSGTTTVTKPIVSTFAAKVDTANMKLLGSQIKSDFKLKGRVSFSKDRNGTRIFNYFMPATTTIAKLNAKADSVEITRKKSISAIRISKSIHTLRKFEGGLAPSNQDPTGF